MSTIYAETPLDSITPHQPPIPILIFVTVVVGAIVIGGIYYCVTRVERPRKLRRRTPRSIGVDQFRRILLTERRLLVERLRSAPKHSRDEISDLAERYCVMESKLTPASGGEIFLEWQVIRPSWLGRRRANVILDPSRTE